MRASLHASLRAYAMLAMFSLGLVAAQAAFADQAHAWLRICNKTSKRVSYHHNEPDSSCGDTCGGNRSRHGWWIMAPNECKTVYGPSAEGKYFEWYAHSTDRTMVWTSASRRWPMPSEATDGYCMCLGCSLSGSPCYPSYNHRRLDVSADNHTMNLVD